MNEDLQKAREIFLTDVDEETRAENEQKIQEWEQQLLRNEAYLNWREHYITKEINRLARDAYREQALTLALNRSLTQEQRAGLYARQDACIFILGLTDQDAKSALNQVLKEVRHALNATS